MVSLWLCTASNNNSINVSSVYKISESRNTLVQSKNWDPADIQAISFDYTTSLIMLLLQVETINAPYFLEHKIWTSRLFLIWPLFSSALLLTGTQFLPYTAATQHFVVLRMCHASYFLMFLLPGTPFPPSRFMLSYFSFRKFSTLHQERVRSLLCVHTVFWEFLL